MRNKIVAGNWKMHKSYQEGLDFTSELTHMVQDEVRGLVEVVLCVPYVHLHAVSRLAAGVERISVGAQDCHQEIQGAFTGEVSAQQIASTGANYVIVGHSERREYFGEQAPLLLLKVRAALAAGLTPIFCCGETKDIRELGTQDRFVSRQIEDALFDLSAEEMAKVVVAYEPVWAIGTGLTASPEQAQDMHRVIRASLASKFGQAQAEATRILYGGSVKAANAKILFSQPDIDGGLVGGASLQSREFADIIKAAMA